VQVEVDVRNSAFGGVSSQCFVVVVGVDLYHKLTVLSGRVRVLLLSQGAHC
jgi:hypothetical protein